MPSKNIILKQGIIISKTGGGAFKVLVQEPYLVVLHCSVRGTIPFSKHIKQKKLVKVKPIVGSNNRGIIWELLSTCTSQKELLSAYEDYQNLDAFF